MNDDPVVAAVHEARKRIASRFVYGLRAIVDDARTRQGKDRRVVVSWRRREPGAELSSESSSSSVQLVGG